MAISVVIPVYNSEKTIVQVLDSVRKQTAVSLIQEIIVVNDGSTDRSHDIITAYREAHKDIIIRLIDKENGGVAAARNDGVRASSGNWIAFIDADDLWLPEKIETQWDILETHPEIDFLGCNNDDIPLRILHRKIDTLYRVTVKDLCLKSFPSSSSILVRKTVFEKVGGFEEGVHHMEDAGFCFRVCTAGYGYYHLPVSLLRIDPFKPFYASSGLSSHLKEMHEGEIRYSRKLKEQRIVSNGFYCSLRVFYFLKYIRRIIKKKINQVKEKNERIES